MSETLKKPYEISIWEDRLMKDGNETYYQEVKLAVIGTDTMDAPNRVYSPILRENVNGEVSLTFSLYYRYYDEIVGDFVVNPFAAYLVNERKVKLYYNDQWYDFVIKECDEDSESQIFSYTATSAFVQELSKNGYNITFNTDLNNNQGTIIELAKKTLQYTDWEVDEENSDVLKQTITEPIYKCIVGGTSFKAKNLTTEETITVAADETIYVFYSYINGKVEQYVQFIREVDKPAENETYSEGKWSYDSNDAINGTNYRFMGKTTYTTKADGTIVINFGGAAASVGKIDIQHQAYRLVYNQRTTYDPVTEHTVNIYRAKYSNNDSQDIYEYEESEYTTSALITSYITNGTMTSLYSGGSIHGWNEFNAYTGSSYPTLEVVTDPPISKTNKLAQISQLNGLATYLRMTFPSQLGDKKENTIYNSGITDNGSLIENIAQGEKYVLRFKAKGKTKNLKALIAGYTYISQGNETVKQINPQKIYFEFNGNRSLGNNYITGGSLNNNKTQYIINDIVQTPSRQYVYQVGDKKYYYDFNNNIYKELDESDESGDYTNYYYLTAAALKPLTRDSLASSSNPIGIFFYNNSPHSRTFDVEEIQLFKYVPVPTTSGTPIFPGSAPEARVVTTKYYYLKPDDNTSEEDVDLYTSLDSVAARLGLNASDIIPLQNEECEKVLSISKEKSNCFNILQSLCETFECWLKINVEHDANGAVSLDAITHKPIKKVAFKEYVGRDNYAGFRYGINLNSIQRSIDSNEFVTKLIVAQPVSDYTGSGVLSITNSTSNPSGESYILNFNYYINQKLVKDSDQFKEDVNQFYEDLKKKNEALKVKNAELANVQIAFVKAQSARSIYAEAYETAAEQYSQALVNFANSIGQSYESYVNAHSDAEILDNSTAANLIYDIYSYAAQRNSYSGLLTNIKKEYDALYLKYKGAPEYTITVSTGKEGNDGWTKLVLSDYIEGFVCTFEKDGTFEQWESGINDRDFDTTARAYTKFIINKLPKDYELQYVDNGTTVMGSSASSLQFNIYDTTNDAGMVRRFKIVPTDTLTKDNIGLIKEVENLQAEKDAIEREFFAKYSYLIQEGTWESTDYIDPELYYLDALQVSNTSAQPKVSYQINVSEISEIEGFKNYLFFVGDRTWIEDTEFFGWETYTDNDVTVETPVKEEVIVSEVEWHLDEPEQNLVTVQNYKTQFEDLFQRISATVQSVQYNQANYSRAASILDANGRINAKLLVNSLNGISADTYSLTSSGIVKATDEGLVIRDLTNSGNLIIIKNSGIERSEDGGHTWLNLISAKGVNTEALTAGKVNTQNIIIGNENSPNFRWDADGLSAYGFSEDGTFDLKTYVRFDKYGIYGIQHNDAYKAESLDDIKDNANFGLTWDGFFIKNKYRDGYVSISSTDDIQVVENDVERIRIGATHFEEDKVTPSKYGILIRNKEGDVVFETDDNGNLTITGTINATAGSFAGRISAAKGTIGGFEIGENELYHGDFGEDESIYLSTGYTSQKSIADYGGERTWAITVSNDFGVDTNGTLYARGANISGTVNAVDGNFSGYVNAKGGFFQDVITVGGGLRDKFIQIDATADDPIIASSDYIHNTTAGWMINGSGDAIFNNVSVRGAIKTAVFEYSEIQAVGGAFLFRPSSTIKDAWIDGEDLVVVTEKLLLFNQNEWVKVSNINEEENAYDVLNNGGLTHIYKIKNKPSEDQKVVLEGAAVDFSSVVPYEEIDIAKRKNGLEELIYTDPDEEDNYYYIEEDEDGSRANYIVLEDLILKANQSYYFKFNYTPFVKKSVQTVLTTVEYDIPEEIDPSVDSYRYLYTETVDTEVIEGKSYYKYDKNSGEYILVELDADTNPSEYREDSELVQLYEIVAIELKTRIIYLGNLSILDITQDNSGEDFVVATEVKTGVTKIYLRDDDEVGCWFKIYTNPDDPDETGKVDVTDICGGALISFGYYDVAFTPFNVKENDNLDQYHLYELVDGKYVLTTDTEVVEGKIYYKEQYENGANNYGIGINSSDNYVALPERSISLFESKILPDKSVKVVYDYKGILGTLPDLGDTLVNRSIYSNHMAGTQGIYTNNMYIGDPTQFIAFYTDENGNKQLRIKANQIVFEVFDDEGNPDWHDVANIESEGIPGPAGEDALQISIHSTLGTQIINGQGEGAMYVRVARDGEEIDPLGDAEIIVSTTIPTEVVAEGTRCIYLDTINRIATLYVYNNGWKVQNLEAEYEWTFRDKYNQPIIDSEILKRKFGLAYDSTTGKVIGKCLYLDATTVDNKIVADVKVIVKEKEI